jgi:hypothetical protein
MKTNLRWTIVFCFMMGMAMLLIENGDMKQIAVFISFWFSLVCQYLDDIVLELKRKNNELQDSKGREDSEGVH